MKCPLRKHDGETEGAHFGDCEEELCAWWVIPYEDKRFQDGKCAMYHLALKSFNVKVLDSSIKGV